MYAAEVAFDLVLAGIVVGNVGSIALVLEPVFKNEEHLLRGRAGLLLHGLTFLF